MTSLLEAINTILMRDEWFWH